MNWRALSGLALLAASPPIAEALSPIGPWRVDYGDAQCVGMRDYGPTEQKITLAIKPVLFGDIVQLALIRRGDQAPPRQDAVAVQLDGNRVIRTTMLVHRANAETASDLVLYRLNMKANFLTQMQAASEVRFSSPDLNLGLKLAQFPAAAKALGDCVDSLRDIWNVDSAKRSRLKRAPMPKQPLNDLFSSSDYPAAALLRNKGGVLVVSLLIDEQGKIADCAVTKTSGNATLDAQSCALLSARARFTPGMDGDGKPAKGIFPQQFVWDPY